MTLTVCMRVILISGDPYKWDPMYLFPVILTHLVFLLRHDHERMVVHDDFSIRIVGMLELSQHVLRPNWTVNELDT